MKSDLISVIVPIYNVEDYIENGVNSIINQTYDNLEIILVDDGSKDKSSKIIDELSKLDNRIKVIHKKNGGVSSARNVGLSVASGRYIIFIDGDDYIEYDYIEYFYNLISKDNYDMAFNSKCFNLTNKNRNNNENYKVFNSEILIEDIYIGNIGCGVAVWNKIYKKEFLEKNSIKFDEDIWYGEGMLFNINCLIKTQKVIVGENILYHQVFNPNSAMRKFNLDSNICGLKSLELQKELLKAHDKIIMNAWKYHKRCFNYSILKGILKSNTKKEYYSEYKKCKRNLRKNISIVLKVKIPLKKKIKYVLIALNPVFWIKKDIQKEIELFNLYKKEDSK